MIKFQRCVLMMLFGCLLLLVTDSAVVSAEMNIRYASFDHWGDETTFILSYESPAKTIHSEMGNRSVEVSLMNQEHGRYLVKGDAEMGGFDEYSFDVKESIYPYMDFTIYMGGGKYCTLSYNQKDRTIENVKPSGTPLDVHITALILTKKYTVGSRFHVWYRGGKCWFEVIPYPQDASPTASVPSNLPKMWYKLTDENDRNVWSAFTYDASTGVFSMYHKNFDDEIVLYSYRKFLANGQLTVQSVDDDASSAASAVYTLDRNGYYTNGVQPIAKYVTDGMRVFLQQRNK